MRENISRSLRECRSACGYASQHRLGVGCFGRCARDLVGAAAREKMIRFTDHREARNSEVGERALELGGRPERVVLGGNHVDPERFAPAPRPRASAWTIGFER